MNQAESPVDRDPMSSQECYNGCEHTCLMAVIEISSTSYKAVHKKGYKTFVIDKVSKFL